jgi:hypothetical protein
VLVINTELGQHAVLGDGLQIISGTNYIHMNFGWGDNDGWYCLGDGQPNLLQVINGIRPDVGNVPLVVCGPNFIELVATNGLTTSVEIEVRAVGTNSVPYSITATDAWVSLSTSEGTATLSPTRHQVIVDSTGLGPGIHDCVLQITGAAANLPRNIRLRVYKSELPQITAQTSDQQPTDPTTTTIAVSARAGNTHTPCTLEAPLEYQWYWNGQPLAGANTNYLRPDNYGVFQCEITGLGGTVSSRPVAISPPPPALSINKPFASADSASGTSLVLSVTARSAFSLLYQLETSMDLQSWTAVGPAFSLGAGGQTNFTLAPSDPNAFFRAVVMP